MIEFRRTNSENIDFRNLVKELDKILAVLDGDDHAFFDQFNQLDTVKYVIVVYLEEEAIGCGAIKEYSEGIGELKRIYVLPKFRSKGVATSILKELETWAKELNFEKIIMETGFRQVEAIQLYIKNGFHSIPNYGHYAEVENSFCFEKIII